MRCPSCGNENREGARFCDSCGNDLTAQPAAAEPRPEQLPADVPAEIAGRYRVRSFLGQGGRKRVYLSEDTATGTDVAIALFDTEGVGASIQARARREAEAMRKLGDHPQVVPVLDTGEDDGSPFIVSRYMPGGDVQGLLAAAGGRLEVQRAVEIAADVTRALEHAHARGIVHRDLKPANVWIDDDGHARLGDFGLATTEARARVSGGTLVGTVAYLPPEQALGEAAGPKSDLYSLGALLYEMLTREPPFPGDDALSIISQHLHTDPVPPSRHNEAVPEALDRAVLALLAKRPEDRPANAAVARQLMLAALEEQPAESAEERPANPLEGLAGGVFVGRERELEQLREAVDSALAGRGSLQLLVGEPGIGKTRASEEIATYARVSGGRVYWGRCREDEGAPAYWPWVQAIRSYVRDADPVALGWQLGAGAPEVAQLVPEVAEKLDNVPASTYAKVIVDTASSLTGGRGQNPFFSTKAQIVIQTGFEILRHIGPYVTIPNLHCLLLNPEDAGVTIEKLTKQRTQRSHELLVAFRDGYLGQPMEQLGGVQGMITTYLSYFLTSEISEVFCANEPTFPWIRSTMENSSVSPCRRSSNWNASTSIPS